MSGFAVLFIDLDGFKTINDQLGHRAGDEILQQTARACAVSAGKSDLAARFGGDEFALIVTGAENCDAVADRPGALPRLWPTGALARPHPAPDAPASA